jgi:DNA-binding SARP family transcriptional activator
MSDLKLLLLGPPRIERDGIPLSFDTRKAIALLAYLAVSGPTATREALATLFFPEYEPDRAYANLRRTLWALNNAGLGPWLDATSEQIGLSRSTDLWLDVAEFHRLIGGSPSIQDLEMAATLYRGDFLAGFSLRDSSAFDEWQFFQAESLRQELASVLARLSRELAGRGAFDAAVTHARRWVSLDPLHEPAHRGLMRLYAIRGHRAAAIRQYQECSQVLQDELGIEPDAETKDLYAEIRKGPQARPAWSIKSSPPPAESTEPVAVAPAHNLPTLSTPFGGRHRELEQIQALLADPTCRLVTLTGPGGIGKTRLAIRAAAEALPAFPNGVCFIPLDPVKSPEVIPGAIHQALCSSGIFPHAGQADAGDPKPALLRCLRDRQML